MEISSWAWPQTSRTQISPPKVHLHVKNVSAGCSSPRWFSHKGGWNRHVKGWSWFLINFVILKTSMMTSEKSQEVQNKDLTTLRPWRYRWVRISLYLLSICLIRVAFSHYRYAHACWNTTMVHEFCSSQDLAKHLTYWIKTRVYILWSICKHPVINL